MLQPLCIDREQGNSYSSKDWEVKSYSWIASDSPDAATYQWQQICDWAAEIVVPRGLALLFI